MRHFLKINLIVILFSNNSISQENLILNPSFEEFVPIGSSDIPSSFQYGYQLETLTYTSRDNTDNNPDGNLTFVVHQIDCWETYNIHTNPDLNDENYKKSAIMVFGENQGFVPLSNPNHVFPFMIPYQTDFTTVNAFGN